MLFMNIEIMIELLAYNIYKNNRENKLLYYNKIADSSLEEDIIFNKKEKALVNSFCKLEIYRSSLIRNSIAESIRCNAGLLSEGEKEFFTKLFVRDYLVQREKRHDLALFNYLSTENIFLNDLLEESKEDLTAIKLFTDFASLDLKNNKEFARVILELDGSYIISMGPKVRNNDITMKIAINNDSTNEIVSFTKSNSKLSKSSEFALLYLKKMKNNQGGNFSVDQVYKTLFKQENGHYPTTIFRNNEQSSWMEDLDFLPKLAKIDYRFLELISDGKIAPLNSDSKNRQIVKK